MMATPTPSIIKLKDQSTSPRPQSKRLVSFENKGNQREGSSWTIENKSDNQSPIRGRPQLQQERRRSFLGSRSSKRLPKNINSNILYSTSPKISLSSSDYVNHDRQSSFASNPARHSIAVVPMAYTKAATNTTFQNQGPPQLHLNTDIDAPEEQASICHSPTWNEEKARKKSSGWTWRKTGSHQKTKKEEEAEQMLRPGRKLNKKPPPAMETQRQSASLANGHGSSESLQTDRRPSSSGSLTKAMRGFLSRRSSQTSNSDASRPPSVLALRPQSQERKPKDLPQKTTAEPVRYEEDEAYMNDITDFVSQMEASARAALEGTPTRSDAYTKASKLPATPPQSRGEEAPLPPIPQSESRQISSRSTSVPASFSRIFGKKDNAAGGYRYPDLNNKLAKGRPTETQKAGQGNWLNRNFGAKPVTNISPQPSGGGGYVQRQRMVQQQRSIVGFQDEMAVKSAYDQFLTDSQLPPTPKDSTESVHPAPEGPPAPIVSQTQGGSSSQYRPSFWPPQQDEPSYRPPPPPKPVAQNKAIHSPERRPLPATPPQIPQKAPSARTNTLQDNARPAPVAVQSSRYEVQHHSLPNIPQVSRTQPAESSRQSKESTATLASTSTATSASSVLTQKLSPTYQLPPLESSQTSPIFPVFSEPTGEGISPPALNLNDNSVRLESMAPVKNTQKPSLPPTTITSFVNKNELLVASENAEGIVRKTSIKRHRSDPELKIPELKVDQEKPDLPSLDFLPELRHQAFTKPKRASRAAFGKGSPTQPPLSPSQFPVPSPSTEIARRPVGQVRASKRSSVVGHGDLMAAGGLPPKPIAKLFVICCQCKFWHDLPSKLYEAMALPQAVGADDNIAGGIHRNPTGDQDGEVKGFQGKIFTQVKCPWCPHCLSTSCCQGWTAITYLHERHH